MSYNEIVEKIVNKIKSIDANYDIILRNFNNGDFGDLQDIDFSNSILIGHVAFWSSGMIFFGLVDTTINDNYEIVPETFLDGTSMSDLEIMDRLSTMFSLMEGNFSM